MYMLKSVNAVIQKGMNVTCRVIQFMMKDFLRWHEHVLCIFIISYLRRHFFITWLRVTKNLMRKKTLVEKAKELHLPSRNCMNTKRELEKVVIDTIIKYKEIIFGVDTDTWMNFEGSK